MLDGRDFMAEHCTRMSILCSIVQIIFATVGFPVRTHVVVVDKNEATYTHVSNSDLRTLKPPRSIHIC
jgi:hypothetical protein